MTVANLRATMSNKEYLEWASFYNYENTRQHERIALAQAESKKNRR